MPLDLGMFDSQPLLWLFYVTVISQLASQFGESLRIIHCKLLSAKMGLGHCHLVYFLVAFCNS